MYKIYRITEHYDTKMSNIIRNYFKKFKTDQTWDIDLRFMLQCALLSRVWSFRLPDTLSLAMQKIVYKTLPFKFGCRFACKIMSKSRY